MLLSVATEFPGALTLLLVGFFLILLRVIGFLRARKAVKENKKNDISLSVLPPEMVSSYVEQRKEAA